MSTTTEVRYPIYRVTARWTEDASEHLDPMPWWPSDPGPGRIWNQCGSMNRMYREDPGADAVESWARDEWWPEYAANELADRSPRDLEVMVSRGHDEEWCGGWFCHWTFDVGQSDADALASFQAYVWRMRQYNQQHGEYKYGDWVDAVCLMGAEDRWRWTARATGTSIVGFGDETGSPPCRCEHCRAKGILRIDH